jgi:propanediol dehydratase small subunit
MQTVAQNYNRFSPLQLELLKIYSFTPSEEELLQIKSMLATFFAQRLSNFVNQAITTKGITEQDLENWLNTDEQ